MRLVYSLEKQRQHGRRQRPDSPRRVEHRASPEHPCAELTLDHPGLGSPTSRHPLRLDWHRSLRARRAWHRGRSQVDFSAGSGANVADRVVVLPARLPSGEQPGHRVICRIRIDIAVKTCNEITKKRLADRACLLMLGHRPKSGRTAKRDRGPRRTAQVTPLPHAPRGPEASRAPPRAAAAHLCR